MGSFQNTFKQEIIKLYKSHKTPNKLGDVKIYDSRKTLSRNFSIRPEEVKIKRILEEDTDLEDILELQYLVLRNMIAEEFADEEARKIINQIITSSKSIKSEEDNPRSALEKADEQLEYRADTLVHPYGFSSKLRSWGLHDWKPNMIASPLENSFLLYSKRDMKIGKTDLEFKFPERNWSQEIILKEWVCVSPSAEIIKIELKET